MKRLFRFGGMFSLLLAGFFLGELIIDGGISRIFEYLPLPIENELFLLLNFIFIFILKKHANFKHYVHSEELKFLLYFLLLVVVYILNYLGPSLNKVEGNKKLIILVTILAITVVKLLLEANIYNTLRKKIKDTSYTITMLVLSGAVTLKLIGTVLVYTSTLILMLGINFNLIDYIPLVNSYLNQGTNSLYLLGYLLMAYVLLKPRETYSF